jgi:hypothetical protein
MTNNALTQFPSALSENVDQKKVNQMIQEANYDATNRFFEYFDPQKSDETTFKTATEAMNSVLIDRVKSDAWIEALCGQEVKSNQRGYLKLHLEHLLALPNIPAPKSLQVMPRIKDICIAAVLGVLLGNVFGNLVGSINEYFDAFSMLLGGYVFDTVGAALGVYAVIMIVKNEWLRKWALAIIGGMASADTAIQFTAIGRFFPFFSFSSYVWRMIFYAIAVIIICVARRTIKHDFPDYRREIELINEQWLHHAAILILVLTFKIKGLEESPYIPHHEDTSTLQKTVSIVQKLQQSQPENVPVVIRELVQMFEAAGLAIQPANEQLYQVLDWDETLKENYDIIGIPRQGSRVKIVMLPITRNGKIEKKGELLLLK